MIVLGVDFLSINFFSSCGLYPLVATCSNPKGHLSHAGGDTLSDYWQKTKKQYGPGNMSQFLSVQCILHAQGDF